MVLSSVTDYLSVRRGNRSGEQVSRQSSPLFLSEDDSLSSSVGRGAAGLDVPAGLDIAKSAPPVENQEDAGFPPDLGDLYEASPTPSTSGSPTRAPTSQAIESRESAVGPISEVVRPPSRDSPSSG